MVHDDRVDGAEEDPDEGHGDTAADERGDEPHDELQSVGRIWVWSANRQLASGGEAWLPDGHDGVEEDGATFADLRMGYEGG